MKNKLLIGVLSITVCLVAVKGISAAGLLPQISTACETKAGLLYAFNDGFSLLKKCDGIGRRVILIGEQGTQGVQGPKGDTGSAGPTGVPGPAGELPDPLEVEIFAQQTLVNGQESAVIDTQGHKLLIFQALTKGAENEFNWFTSNDQTNWTDGGRIYGRIGVGATNGFVEKTFTVQAPYYKFQILTPSSFIGKAMAILF